MGVEEPSQDASESESEEELDEDSQRRRASVNSVIDRTLSRSSSSLSTSSKLAFQSRDNGAPSGFKVPALLRRATSNLSVESQGQVTTTERSLGADSQGLKKGGGKGSSINFHTKAKVNMVEKGEEKRKAERAKEGRQRVRKGLGALGKGSFS